MATAVVYHPPTEPFPFVAVIFMEGDIIGTMPFPTLEEAEGWLKKTMQGLANAAAKHA